MSVFSCEQIGTDRLSDGSRASPDVEVRTVGIDLGKTTFHLVALGEAGNVLVRKKFTQRQLLVFTLPRRRNSRTAVCSSRARRPGFPNMCAN
jgi:hypothetical protein